MWNRVYREGRGDFNRGADLESGNPYDKVKNVEDYWNWRRGWLCAELDWVVETNGADY